MALLENELSKAGLSAEETAEVGAQDVTPSVLIGVLLVIPVVLLLVITLVMRAQHKGMFYIAKKSFIYKIAM